MSFLRPTATAAALATGLMTIQPAAAETTRPSANRLDLTITFEGTANRTPATYCPAVNGTLTVDFGDGKRPDVIHVAFDGKKYERTNDPRQDAVLADLKEELGDICPVGPKGVGEQSTSVFLQGMYAAEATVTPQRNGCLIENASVTTTLDFTVGDETIQSVRPAINLPQFVFRRAADANVGAIETFLPRTGETIAIITKAERSGLWSRAFHQLAKGCGLE